MIKVGAIGALGCGSDAGLDIRLDLGPKRFIAGICTIHPAWMFQNIRNSRARTIGRLDVVSG
jgi:hypothetical protein